MGEPLQLVGAAFGLAETALQTARLLQKLARARTEAKDLYDDTAQLHSLAVRVASVLKARDENGRHSDGSATNDGVEETLESISSSILSCKRAVLIIHRTVRPLTQESEHSWIQRVKYVWSSDLIQSQEKLIVLHLQLLGVNLQILHGLDQAQMMQMMRSVLNYSHRLQGNAKEEQSVVVRTVANIGPSELKKAKIDTSDVLAGPSGASGDDGEILEPLSPIQDADKQDILGRTFPAYLDTEGATLAVAVRRNDAPEVKKLLVAGLDISVKDDDDWTLIHHASYHLDRPTLGHLLSDPERLLPGFIDATTKRGDTALMLVAKQAEDEKSREIAELLISCGCDLNIVNEGETNRDALYYVIERSKTTNRVNFAELLVKDHGASIALVQEAFPDGIKQWPTLMERTMEPIERRESWTDRMARKLSISRSNDSEKKGQVDDNGMKYGSKDTEVRPEDSGKKDWPNEKGKRELPNDSVKKGRQREA